MVIIKIMATFRSMVITFSLFISILLVVSCGGSSDTENNVITASKCDNLTWSVNTAEPLDTLSVSGIPPEMTGLYAVVNDSPSTSESITFAERQPDGTVNVIAPIHPTGNLDGGDAAIVITDGVIKCTSQSFAIKPLPEASSSAIGQDFLDNLTTYQGLVYADLGLTAETVRSLQVGSYSADLIPLYMAQKYLDALGSYLESGSVLLSATELDMINRLLEKGGVNVELQNIINSYISFSSGANVLASKTIASRAQIGAKANRTAQLSSDSCSQLPTNALGEIIIGNAAELSQYMIAQKDADIAINGASTKQISSTTGYMAAAAGVVSAPVGVVAGFGLYAHSLVQGYRTNTYPSKFTSLDFDITEGGRIAEDYMDPRGPGVYPRWENAVVDAASNGWNLTKPAFDTVLQIAGVAGAVFGDAVTVADDVAGAIDGVAWGELANYLESEGLQSDCLQIPAKTWGPVDVTDDQWTDNHYSFGSVEELGHQTFKPVNTGSTTLEVKVDSSKFGFRNINKEKEVTVPQKNVLVSPSVYRADPNDVVTFTASIADTRFPEVEPVWSYNAGTELNKYSIGDQHTLELKMPADAAAFPVKVVAESQTLTLPVGANPRKGEAEIKSTAIELSPQQICLNVGQSADFTATLSDTSQATVNWTASAGSVSASSTSTAPHTVSFSATTEGNYTVRATLSTDADTFDEAIVNVGPCVDMYISGAAVSSISAPLDECANPPLVNQDFEERLILIEDELPIPPARPGNTWQGREEHLLTTLGQAYTGSLSHGDPAQCKVFTAQSDTQSDITFGSDQFGMASLNESVSYQYNCVSDAENDTSCSAASSATFGWSVMHYVDLEAASSYRFKADISCTAASTDSGYALYLNALKLNVIFLRYLNQAGEPVDANNCNSTNDCSQDEIVLPISGTLNCMNGESIHVDQLIPFRAPPVNGQTDLIVVTTILSPDITTIDFTDPAVAAEYQTVGAHTATMDLSAAVSMKPAP